MCSYITALFYEKRPIRSDRNGGAEAIWNVAIQRSTEFRNGGKSAWLHDDRRKPYNNRVWNMGVMLYANKHLRAGYLMQRGLAFDRHVNAM